MRKISYYIIASFMCVLPLSSCSDMLEEESSVEIGKNKYMNNASEAEVVLLGVYRSMVTDALYGYHLSILFDITTDLAQCEGNTPNSFREIPTNAFTTSSSNVQATWSTLYKSVYNANDFLETLDTKVGDYSDKDKRLATIYMAEARALRAMYYFELVRWYGNIVLMTNTEMSTKHPSTFVQADPVDVYKFIEADLLFAGENLPYAVDDTERSSNNYRMSKGAALGLLAKVYATWAGAPVKDTSKWENAAKTAQIVIESNKHKLLENYEQLWKNTCNGIWDAQESLIEVSFYSPTITGSGIEDPSGRIGKWNGVIADKIVGVRESNAGNVKVVYTFARDWEKKENDLRYNASIADYKYKGTVKTPYYAATDKDDRNKQLYTPAKWNTEKYLTQGSALINSDRSNINWYVLRYADVLLIYAEALNEWNQQGPTTEAYDAVNRIRRRGFGLPISSASTLADLPDGLNYASFQEAIRQERAYELAFEGGRRQDLVRWDIYYETIDQTDTKLRRWLPNANFAAINFTKKGKHELFPIPQRDKDLMTQSKQNPGWN